MRRGGVRARVGQAVALAKGRDRAEHAGQIMKQQVLKFPILDGAAIGFRAPSRAHARGRRRREKREGLAIKHSIDFFSEFVVLSMFLRTYFGVREPLVRWIAGAGG